MKNKILHTLFYCFLLVAPLPAQVYHFPVSRLFPAPGPEKYYLDNQGRSDTENGPGIQYQVLLQTGFFSGFAGNGAAYSITPTVYYRISPKFSLSGGVSYTTFSGRGYEPYQQQGQGQQAVVFLRGTYAVRSNLYLTGTVVKNLNNKSFYRQNPYYYNAGDSYSLQLDYFLSKSFRLGAEIRVSNNYYPYSFPYRYNPFYHPWY